MNSKIFFIISFKIQWKEIDINKKENIITFYIENYSPSELLMELIEKTFLQCGHVIDSGVSLLVGK